MDLDGHSRLVAAFSSSEGLVATGAHALEIFIHRDQGLRRTSAPPSQRLAQSTGMPAALTAIGSTLHFFELLTSFRELQRLPRSVFLSSDLRCHCLIPRRQPNGSCKAPKTGRAMGAQQYARCDIAPTTWTHEADRNPFRIFHCLDLHPVSRCDATDRLVTSWPSRARQPPCTLR